MSNSQTNDEIKAQIYEQLHATPDGTFHWTKRHKKILAELEATKPFATIPEYSHSEHWLSKEIAYDQDNAGQVAIEVYVNDVINGIHPFSKDTWAKALDHFNGQQRNWTTRIQFGVFSRLSTHMELNELLDILAFTMVHEEDNSVRRLSSYHQNRYPLHDMFVLLQAQPVEKKAEALVFAQQIVDNYKHNLASIAMYFLFPHDITIYTEPNTTQFDVKENMRSFDEIESHFDRFFHDATSFGICYSECYRYWYDKQNSWSEPYFLLMIKHQKTLVVDMMRPYIKTCQYNHHNGFHAPTKVRKNFKLLSCYHHRDVLDFLLSYSYTSNSISFIKQWIDNYPLFSLERLCIGLQSEQDKEAINNIRGLIKNALNDNPLLIAPLQEKLKSQPSQNINNDMPIDLLSMLQEMTANITEADIQNALDVQIHKLIPKQKTKRTATKPTVKKTLRFPTLPITQIKANERVNNQKIHANSQMGGRWQEEIEAIIKNPEEQLYPRYADKKEADIVRKNFDKWDETQRYLALFTLKPSLICSEKYQQAKAGNVLFSKDDYTNVSKKNVLSDSNIRDYFYVLGTVFTLLPDTLKIAIINGDFSPSHFHYDDNFRIRYLYCLCEDVLLTIPKQTLTGVTKLLPYFATYGNTWQPAILLEILPYLGNHQAARYVINYINTKTNNHITKQYYKDFPDVIVNEAVYLLFSKQDDSFLKKVKKNARGFFEWMLVEHKKKLLATLKKYDDQLIAKGKIDVPVLVPFATTYQTWQQQKVAQTKQKTADTTQTLITQAKQVDENAVPQTLLHDDWKKATRKRKLTLDDEIDKHSLPTVILEKTQQALPKAAQARLLQILMVSNECEEPMPMLMDTLSHISKDSQTALAKALWYEYERLDLPNNEKWLMVASSFLYHEQLGDKVWQFFKDWEPYFKQAHVKRSFEVLVQQAINYPNTASSKNALHMLMYIIKETRESFSDYAVKQLIRYLKATGLTENNITNERIVSIGLEVKDKQYFIHLLTNYDKGNFYCGY